ncbi:MAG: hypothetical protein IJ220_03795 [Clostridia bacterium]|nr:hypothetical protein [Clostridia bacterium]
MEGIFELHATLSEGNVYRAIIQDPVFSNNGNMITYSELAIRPFAGGIQYYPKPKTAVISNCPIRLLEYTEK